MPSVQRLGQGEITPVLIFLQHFFCHPHFQKPRPCLKERGKGLGGGVPSWVSGGRVRGSRHGGGNGLLAHVGPSWELGDPFQQPGLTLYPYFTWIFLFPPSTALLPYLNASMSFFIDILSSLA